MIGCIEEENQARKLLKEQLVIRLFSPLVQPCHHTVVGIVGGELLHDCERRIGNDVDCTDEYSVVASAGLRPYSLRNGFQY